MLQPQAPSFCQTVEYDNLTCRLCPVGCSIAPNRFGACGVRGNRNGLLRLDTRGRVSTRELLTPDHLPLFHDNPSIQWLRLGMRGCNMRCAFCNTATYSQQGTVPQHTLSPQAAVDAAIAAGAGGISFGVNEPLIAYEYVWDVFALARAAGLRTHVATSGFFTEEAMRQLGAVLNDATIGLKGLDRNFLEAATGGIVETICASARVLSALGVHVEVTWLLIPGRTNREQDALALLNFLESLDHPPPVLILPLEPAWRWEAEVPATPEQSLQFVEMLGSYDGEVYDLSPGSPHTDTRCRKCGRVLVRRGAAGYLPARAVGRHCPGCGERTPFIGVE